MRRFFHALVTIALLAAIGCTRLHSMDSVGGGPTGHPALMHHDDSVGGGPTASQSKH
jgi:hypothetical protein